MYNPLNICDIEYIEITYNDSKMYWAIKGYTRFNTSI